MKQLTSIAITLILFFTQIHTNTRLDFMPPKKNKCLSHAFLKQLVDCFQIKTFVETGTYLGDSTAVAAELFEKVHTIELSESLYNQAKKRFAHYLHVELHHGDSSELLPLVLTTIHNNTLFWLDGHFSKGNTAQGEKNTPILEELAAIKNAKMHDAIILIDDIRLFQNTQPYPDPSLMGYPTFQQLCAALQILDSSYVCYLIGDVALAYPSSKYNVTPCNLIQACTASRLYTQEHHMYDEILEIEKCISKANPQEKQLLLNSIEQFTGYGSGHYHLWAGLIAESNQQYAQALTSYAQAKNNGVIDWRPQFYTSRCHVHMNNYEDALATLLPLIPYAPFCTAIQNLYGHCKDTLKKLKMRALASLILPTKNTHIGYDNCLMKENGEHLILKTLVHTGDIVFDVGANVGEWSSHVLALKKHVTLHAFEPIPTLCQKLYNIINKNRVHNLALSNTCGTEILYCYINHRLSSLYERKSAHLQPKQIIQISTDTLSNVCRNCGIDTINYLKIDTEGAELFVLQGAQELIDNHMIELIQFEYGGAYKDAGTTLQQVYDLLTQAGYSIYRIVPQGLEYLDAWNNSLECFKYSNYLAVCPNFME